ncbi:hypothetical protein PIB30_067357 [Stylosanthes scabra]|uniref:Uncharacterized protein n=1 Tax=Stylosanthes scabra TaxID=79078 RepID=A0ABU6RMM2_9FABA|nr:hypothetical protein [Stylosanthes scabra]
MLHCFLLLRYAIVASLTSPLYPSWRHHRSIPLQQHNVKEDKMSDCKRCVSLPSVMEATSSFSKDSIFKKRKVITSTSSASFNDVFTILSEGFVSSVRTVASSAFCSYCPSGTGRTLAVARSFE